MSETNEQTQPVPYAEVEWMTLADAARKFFPDDDGGYRRLRSWVDREGHEVAAGDETDGEFVEGKIRWYREDSGARNAKRFVAVQDVSLKVKDKPVAERDKSRALEVPTEVWEDMQELIREIRDISEAKGNAEGKNIFFKENLIPSRDAEITELKERAAQLEAERDQLRSQLEAKTKATDEPDAIDLRHEQDTQPGWFKRMFKGSTPPVSAE